MRNTYGLVCGALVLGLAGALKADTGGSFPAKDLSGITVNAGGGQISIEGGKSDIVEVSPMDASSVCEMTSKVSAKTLKLEKHKDKKGGISNCRIKIPAQLAVKVEMGAGNLALKDISGAVDVKNTAGKTQLSGLTGELKLKMTTGSMTGDVNPTRLDISGTCGKIAITGLTGGAVVNRTCGELNLTWSAAPSSEIRVKSGGGTANLVFPSAAVIKTELKTRDSGKIRDDFPGKTGTLVAVTMGGGNINIIKAASKN